jgi:hypothetical protein
MHVPPLKSFSRIEEGQVEHKAREYTTYRAVSLGETFQPGHVTFKKSQEESAG